MSTSENTIKFRKTRDGDWAAFGPSTILRENVMTASRYKDWLDDENTDLPTVDITKKNGETCAKHVRAVSKGFDIDGIEFAYGFLWDQRDLNEIATRFYALEA